MAHAFSRFAQEDETWPFLDEPGPDIDNVVPLFPFPAAPAPAPAPAAQAQTEAALAQEDAAPAPVEEAAQAQAEAAEDEDADPVDELVRRLLTSAPTNKAVNQLRGLDEETRAGVLATLAAGGVDAARLNRWLAIPDDTILDVFISAELTAEEIVRSALLDDPASFPDSHPLMVKLMDQYDRRLGAPFFEAVRELERYAPAGSEEQIEALITAVRAASARRKHGLRKPGDEKAEEQRQRLVENCPTADDVHDLVRTGRAHNQEYLRELENGGCDLDALRSVIAAAEEAELSGDERVLATALREQYPDEGTLAELRDAAILKGLKLQALGYTKTPTRKRVLYFRDARGEVLSLTPRDLGNVGELLNLNPDLETWVDTFPKVGRRGAEVTVDLPKASAFLIAACRKAGRFSMDKLTRGAGVWKDGRHVVINDGEVLIVDGVAVDEDDVAHANETLGLRGVYEPSEHGLGTADALADPLTAEEGQAVLDLLRRLDWSDPGYADIAAGVIGTALVSGALDWRTHLWVVGGAGSGKSTLLNEVYRRAFGTYPVSAEGGTVTEAGLRQSLLQSARVVFVDEAEADKSTQKQAANLTATLRMLRSMSSGAETPKGAAGGVPVHYTLRSTCFFFSITHGVVEAADARRFAVVQLNERKPADLMTKEEKIEAMRWKREFRAAAEALLDDRFPARLQARMATRLQQLEETQETIDGALRMASVEANAANGASWPLAGLWTLTHDSVITEEEALEAAGGWAPMLNRAFSCAADDDRNDALQSLLQLHIGGVRQVDNSLASVSLYRLVRCALNARDPDAIEVVRPEEATDLLASHGMDVDAEGGWLHVSSKSELVKRHFSQTTGVAGWTDLLERADGVERQRNEKGKAKVRRFVGMNKQPTNYISINLDHFVEPDEKVTPMVEMERAWSRWGGAGPL